MADEEIKHGFCITAFPPCESFTFFEFPDEKDVIVLVLEYFKRFLPQVLERKTDYYDQPIVIDPKDIGLTVQKEFGPYVVVISITDDNSTYPDEQFYRENTEYAFQIDLQVYADDEEAAMENLIKLKSGIKTMLINMDNNLQLTTVIDGFSYGEFGIDESRRFVRQGTYRFAVADNNFKE